VPAGKYRVCPQRELPEHLNPCWWTVEPTLVEVPAGQSVAMPPIKLAKSHQVSILVEDSLKLMEPSLTPGKRPGSILIGVFNDAGFFVSAKSDSQATAGGRRFSISVPSGRVAQLSISSATLQVADASGRSLQSEKGAMITLFPEGGKNSSQVVLRVVGEIRGTVGPPN